MGSFCFMVVVDPCGASACSARVDRFTGQPDPAYIYCSVLFAGVRSISLYVLLFLFRMWIYPQLLFLCKLEICLVCWNSPICSFRTKGCRKQIKHKAMLWMERIRVFNFLCLISSLPIRNKFSRLIWLKMVMGD